MPPAPETALLLSLYRGTLRLAKQIDANPAAKALLVAQPDRLYDRGSRRVVDVPGAAPSSSSAAAGAARVNALVHAFNGGEHFAPSSHNADGVQAFVRAIWRQRGQPAPRSARLGAMLGRGDDASNEVDDVDAAFASLRALEAAAGAIAPMLSAAEGATAGLRSTVGMVRRLRGEGGGGGLDDGVGVHDAADVAEVDFRPDAEIALERAMRRHTLRLAGSDAGSLAAAEGAAATTPVLHEGTFLLTHPVACLQQPTLSHALILLTNSLDGDGDDAQLRGSDSDDGNEGNDGGSNGLVQGVVVNKPMGYTLREIVDPATWYDDSESGSGVSSSAAASDSGSSSSVSSAASAPSTRSSSAFARKSAGGSGKGNETGPPPPPAELLDCHVFRGGDVMPSHLLALYEVRDTTSDRRRVSSSTRRRHSALRSGNGNAELGDRGVGINAGGGSGVTYGITADLPSLRALIDSGRVDASRIKVSVTTCCSGRSLFRLSVLLPPLSLSPSLPLSLSLSLSFSLLHTRALADDDYIKET